MQAVRGAPWAEAKVINESAWRAVYRHDDGLINATGEHPGKPLAKKQKTPVIECCS